MSIRATTINWWNTSLADVGVQAMDRTLASNANWDDVLRSGQAELAAALQASQMNSDPGRRVLDVGCGVGRLSFALAARFGAVVGVDISPSLIETARSHNVAPNLSFETVTGSPLEACSRECYDTIFANEVFYYLDWETLTAYSRDAFRLLRAGGEYVFQLNMEPIPLKTRLSWVFRAGMYRCGIKTWRGWSNSPGFTRKYHPAGRVQTMLQSLGFEDVTISVGQSIRQTWFVARANGGAGQLQRMDTHHGLRET